MDRDFSKANGLRKNYLDKANVNKLDFTEQQREKNRKEAENEAIQRDLSDLV